MNPKFKPAEINSPEIEPTKRDKHNPNLSCMMKKRVKPKKQDQNEEEEMLLNDTTPILHAGL